MTKKEINFKYEVGDCVLPKAMAHLLKEGEGCGIGMEAEMRYTIKERVYNECYNNSQIHYTCQAITRGGGVGGRLVIFAEPDIEVVETFRTREEIRKDKK